MNLLHDIPVCFLGQFLSVVILELVSENCGDSDKFKSKHESANMHLDWGEYDSCIGVECWFVSSCWVYLIPMSLMGTSQNFVMLLLFLERNCVQRAVFHT